MGNGRGIAFAIEVLDKFSAPFTAFNAKMAESTAGLRVLGSRMGNLGRESGITRMAGAGAGVGKNFGAVTTEAAALGGKLTLVGGALAYGFKKGFVDVASQFEKFETILNTLNMGDTAKSKTEMSWISDFAAKTPYELSEVTEAFVQLRSYGMEPMHGLLQTLGDTSSAMGKPLKQAVEAIADAVTGENERLKEFGIVGKKVGDKVVYSYTNAAGAQAQMMAKASDRAAIQATLTKIWSEKYGGGMDKLSHTFGGMMSNLSDAWSRFAMKVMSNGAFDWMKTKLSGILETIDRMSADGSLDAWAQQWGERLSMFLERAWEAGKGFAGALMAIGSALAWTADLLGGWENLGILVASLMGVKLVVSLGQLAVSFFTLGAAIMTTPIGWFMAAIALVTAGVVAIWKNWEKITGWFRDKTPKWILRMFGAEDGGPAASGEDKAASGREGAAPGAMADWGKAWGGDAAANAPGKAPGADGGSPFALPDARPSYATSRPNFGAADLQRQMSESRSTSVERTESKVLVEIKAPKGTEIRQEGAPVNMNVDWSMGPAMAY